MLKWVAVLFAKKISAALLIKLMIGMVIAGAVGFPVTYATNRVPVGFIPQPPVLTPAAPRFINMVYGGFGDSQFNKPMDVTAANGRVYVSDTNNRRVQVYDQNGAFLFRFGEQGSGPGQFEFPYGIAADAAGNIFVADLYLSRVSVFDASGRFQRYFPDPQPGQQAAVDGPGDIYITQDQVYITDINLSQVAVFDHQGQLVRHVGQPGLDPGQLRAPNGVAVDREGNIWVVDSGNARVQVYDPEGKYLFAFNGSADGNGESVFINPRGIGIRGNMVLVVSSLTHNIWGFDRRGQQQFTFGGLGTGLTQFMLPNGMFIDGDGQIYVTDTSNQRVAVYR